MDCGGKNGRNFTRRDFIKTTAAGIAATYAGLNLGRLLIGQQEAIAQIADPLRVVQIYNASLTNNPTASTRELQDAAISKAVVNASMDQGVMCLTQTTTPQAAWARIVPTSIPLGQALIFIKVNYLGGRLATHPAIVDYVISHLVNLGISPANIYVYDERALDYLSGALGNPANIHFGNFNRTGSYSFAGHATQLTTILHNNTNYWLINIAVPKQHGSYVGGFSLTMKNHYGTFEPNSHVADGYLAGINSHAKILDRTILSVIDAIYGSNGADGSVVANFNKIIMGKSSLAVDYLAAKYLIGVQCGTGWSGNYVDWTRVNAWPSEGNFGITLAQLQNLPLITNCASDTIKPKAPTNLNVIKG